MNYSAFISLVRGDGKVQPSREELNALLKDYPWFQTARLLLAKEKGPELTDTELRLAAVYAGNRSRLRELVRSDRVVAKSAGPETAWPEKPVTESSSEKSVFLKTEEHASGIFSQQRNDSVFTAATRLEPVVSPPDPPATAIPAEQSPASDPQEIIRRRLEEIFSTKPVPADPVIEQQPVTPMEAQVEPATEAIASATEPFVPVSPAPAKSPDAEEVVIRKEYMQLQDDVDREELAHAAEETILQSLESLPVREEDLSFTAWLKRNMAAPFGAWEEVHAGESGITVFAPAGTATSSPTPPSAAQLIDRFIATEPRIAPSKAEFYSPAIQAKRSVEEDENLISETLANIYMEQGMLAKARQAYEKLSLLYPEKSSSFAALIQKIDTLNTEE